MDQADIIATTTDNLVMKGELSFNTVKTLWNKSKKLFTYTPTTIKIDLSQISHSDSAGLALLIAWQQLASKQHKTITFKNLPQQMLNMAKISKLNNILHIEDNHHAK
jgi:phospholipid transport system transporter-binding protein